MGLGIALGIIDAEINRLDLELFELLLSKILGSPQITNPEPFSQRQVSRHNRNCIMWSSSYIMRP